MNKIYFFSIVLLLFVSGCTPSIQDEIPRTYDVEWHSQYVSSAGNRNLDIMYSVANNEVTSCTGTYTQDMVDGRVVEECDVTQLEDYNAPFQIVAYDLNNLSGYIDTGRSRYEWNITI